jgi:hypothetical protein
MPINDRDRACCLLRTVVAGMIFNAMLLVGLGFVALSFTLYLLGE